MSTHTDDLRTRKRIARRLTQDAIDGAGSRAAMGRALGHSPSTISHQVTTRVNPELHELISRLIASPEASARTVARAVTDAVEIGEVASESTEDLVERGCWLIEAENQSCEAESTASLIGTAAHLRSLGIHQDHIAELRQTMIVLETRGVDLHAEYRRRQT